MEKQLPPPIQTLEEIHGKLVCQSMIWGALRDRVERTGGRDAELLERKERAMEVMTQAGGLLDQYVLVKSLANIEVQGVEA